MAGAASAAAALAGSDGREDAGTGVAVDATSRLVVAGAELVSDGAWWAGTSEAGDRVGAALGGVVAGCSTGAERD